MWRLIDDICKEVRLLQLLLYAAEGDYWVRYCRGSVKCEFFLYLFDYELQNFVEELCEHSDL